MIQDISLDEIIDYAKGRPNDSFRLSDTHECLVCNMLKERGYARVWYNFNGTFRAYKDNHGIEYEQYRVPNDFNNLCLREEHDNFLTGKQIVRYFR